MQEFVLFGFPDDPEERAVGVLKCGGYFRCPYVEQRGDGVERHVDDGLGELGVEPIEEACLGLRLEEAETILVMVVMRLLAQVD